MCAARAPSTATRSGGCERRRRRPGCRRGGAPLEQRRSHGGARIPPTWVEASDEIGHGAAQSSWPATRGEGPDAAPATRAKRRGRRSPRGQWSRFDPHPRDPRRSTGAAPCRSRPHTPPPRRRSRAPRRDQRCARAPAAPGAGPARCSRGRAGDPPGPCPWPWWSTRREADGDRSPIGARRGCGDAWPTSRRPRQAGARPPGSRPRAAAKPPGRGAAAVPPESQARPRWPTPARRPRASPGERVQGARSGRSRAPRRASRRRGPPEGPAWPS